MKGLIVDNMYYEMSDENCDTLMAHGVIREIGTDKYRLATANEIKDRGIVPDYLRIIFEILVNLPGN